MTRTVSEWPLSSANSLALALKMVCGILSPAIGVVSPTVAIHSMAASAAERIGRSRADQRGDVKYGGVECDTLPRCHAAATAAG